MNSIRFLVMSVFLLVSSLQAGCNSQESSKRVTQERIEAAVRAILKDPDSAQFKEARLLEGDWACVAANAKNSFGGYTGFKDVVLAGSGGQWVAIQLVNSDSEVNCEQVVRFMQKSSEKAKASKEAAKAEEEQRKAEDERRKAAQAMIDTTADRRDNMTSEELLAAGQKIYEANCAACHKADGMGSGPIKKLNGSPLLARPDFDAALRVVLFGAANGAMPSWKQLSNTEIASIVTYVGNSWSNNSGVLVQPAQVSKVRNSPNKPGK